MDCWNDQLIRGVGGGVTFLRERNGAEERTLWLASLTFSNQKLIGLTPRSVYQFSAQGLFNRTDFAGPSKCIFYAQCVAQLDAVCIDSVLCGTLRQA